MCKILNLGIGRKLLSLTLSTSLLFISCTSTSQYYEYREESGTKTKKEIILDENVISKGIKYDIIDEKVSLNKTNIVNIPVVVERYEEKRIKKRLIEKARFDQYRVVVTKKSTAGNAFGTGFLAGLLTGFLGSLVGSAMKKGEESYANEGAYIGFGIGFIIGISVGAFSSDARIRETNGYRTGSSEVRTLSDRIITERGNFIISSAPVYDLKLRLGSEDIGFKKKFIYTNLKGIAHATIVQLPHNYALNDRVLMRKVKSWDRIGGLPSSSLNSLIDRVDDEICNSSLIMNVETLGEKQNGWDVTNAKESISIPVRHIRENDVYNIMNSLLNEKRQRKAEERQAYIRRIVSDFNSHIKRFTVYVEDEKSHSRIPAEITISSYAPSAQSFLDDYCKGDELRHAISMISYYPSNGRSVTENTGYDGEAVFYLYVPAKYSIKIVNPHYNFVEEKLYIKASDLDRRVTMVEKGTKIKIGIWESKGGID